MTRWHLSMVVAALATVAGLAMRPAGIGLGGWVAGIGAAALAFLFLVPVMGERSRQPPTAPERRVHWGD